jgi:formyl-CoA transferase
LVEAGVPTGPVYTVPQIAQHSQMRDRGQLQTVHVRALDRDVQVVGAGYRLKAGALPITLPPPSLGEHTDQVLTEAGFSAEEIAALRTEGAL